MMNASNVERLEHDLREAGRFLPYPPTPQLAAQVMRLMSRRAVRRRLSPRWAWALASLLVLLGALMLVPPARAAILDFIQIGVVRIFRGPNPPPAQAPTSHATSGFQLPVTATPMLQGPATATPAVTTMPSALNLAGETTLADARSRLNFPILLPGYPPDIGQPDKVYLQELGSPMLILVWLDPAQGGRVRMSLDEIAPGSWAIEKFKPPVIEKTQVNGQPAVWTEGPYMVQVRNGNYELHSLVEGNMLIWTEADITYRLGTDLPLDEAIKIAESLKPIRSTEIPIPADLDHARHLVQWLEDAGIDVLSVQHSNEGALFQSADQAAWIKTDIGIANAVFFLHPAESEYIEVTPIQGQEAGRHLYKVQAPPAIMPKAVTIDAAYLLYFTVRRGMFIETDSPELHRVLQSLPANVNETITPGMTDSP